MPSRVARPVWLAKGTLQAEIPGTEPEDRRGAREAPLVRNANRSLTASPQLSDQFPSTRILTRRTVARYSGGYRGQGIVCGIEPSRRDVPQEFNCSERDGRNFAVGYPGESVSAPRIKHADKLRIGLSERTLNLLDLRAQRHSLGALSHGSIDRAVRSLRSIHPDRNSAYQPE
jgi:hypothetical protein